MILMTFACNYDFANRKEENAVTQISIPAESEDDAVRKLTDILGGEARYEELKSKFFIQEIREYE